MHFFQAGRLHARLHTLRLRHATAHTRGRQGAVAKKSVPHRSARRSPRKSQGPTRRSTASNVAPPVSLRTGVGIPDGFGTKRWPLPCPSSSAFTRIMPDDAVMFSLAIEFEPKNYSTAEKCATPEPHEWASSPHVPIAHLPPSSSLTTPQVPGEWARKALRAKRRCPEQFHRRSFKTSVVH